MGCDIHVKTYLWSNVENRYIDMFEILESYNISYENTEFNDIVGDRFYDLFGAFGHSGRSNYPEMDCIHRGFPAFLKGSTLEKILTDADFCNFGFVWCILKELDRNILRYNRALRDPDIYYRNDPDDEAYLDYKNGCFTKDEFEKFHRDVISGMKNIRKRIKNLRNALTKRFVLSKNGYIDIDKTVFLIWFDN